MPNRLIREGFLDSEAVHALSDAAECFYHRLLLAADDAGRIDGRVEMLRARLFPLDSSRRASDVEKALSECQQQGLVYPYKWDGRPFLQLTKWQRCSPCVTSKFPWSDGSHKIAYEKRETRDGEKEFVKTSLSHPDAISIPSPRDTDGSRPLMPPMSGDGDGVLDVLSVEANASTGTGLSVVDGYTLPPTKPSLSPEAEIRARGVTSPVWAAYSEAYRKRYGVDPVRNAKINGQLANFVSRVPGSEAPHIAAFYLRSSKSIYVRDKHPIGFLVRDAETLRTEWVTGQQGTESEARAQDRTAGRGNVFRELIQESADAQQRTA